MFEDLVRESEEARKEVTKLWQKIEIGSKETSERAKLAVTGAFREAKEEVAREAKGFPFSNEQLKSIKGSLENNLGGAFRNIAMQTKSAKDAFKDMREMVVQDIDRIITRMMAMQTVQMMLGGIGLLFGEGGIMPGQFQAMAGSALTSMPITPMRQGGLYSRPTLGLIAEAGTPEAVVPLKGGGIPVEFRERSPRERPTYIVNAFSEEFMQQQINRALSQNAEVIINMVQQDIMAGGNTYQLIRGLR